MWQRTDRQRDNARTFHCSPGLRAKPLYQVAVVIVFHIATKARRPGQVHTQLWLSHFPFDFAAERSIGVFTEARTRRIAQRSSALIGAFRWWERRKVASTTEE